MAHTDRHAHAGQSPGKNGVMMRSRTRARVGSGAYWTDDDPAWINGIKRERRTVKRRERQAWRREAQEAI